jgi:transposase
MVPLNQRGGDNKMKRLFVGIDVSKGALEVAATVDGKTVASSRSVGNDESGWRKLVKWACKNAGRLGCEEVHYCLEATGVYSEGVLEYLQEQPDSIVSMVNPAQIKAFAQSQLLRTKTDRVDATFISFYVALIKPEATEKIPVEIKELRSMVRHLEYLIERRAQAKTRLESSSNALVVASIVEAISHDDEQIKEMETKIRDHVDKYKGLRDKIELLKTIPGISDTTARILLCEFNMAGQEGRISAKAQTAHAGLAPGQRQSGKSVKGKSRICKTGNSRLRKCAYLPALSAIQYNPLVKVFYERLVSKGKPKMVAVIAAMRKLIVLAIGVLNNGVPFDQNWMNRRSLKTA